MKPLLSLLFLLFFSAQSFASALPELVFQKVQISEKSSPKVHRLVKTAAQQVHMQPRKARINFVAALKLVKQGAKIDEYNYIWIQYGLLKSSFETNTSKFGPGTKRDYIKTAKNLLAFLDKVTNARTGVWAYTELSAFTMEAYRTAGNGLAWYTYEDPKSSQGDLDAALDRALSITTYIRDPRDYYIYDTQVRLLLRLNRKNDAYKIVAKVLKEKPRFSDFQDFKTNKDYQKWLKSHRK